jgi:ABC-type uncharacterized transport system involved in gliding motility auxiliary subunit
MKRRNTLLTTNALISAVLVVALLVAVNYLATEHHVRWDLTATREHSLSPQTIKVLRTLPGPIQAIAFPNADSTERYRQILSTYQYYSKDFQYQIVDPDRNPAEAQKYKISSYGQIVLQHGKASYTVDDGTEEALTNGLLHVLETTKKTIYVLQGEGEASIDDFTRLGMGSAKQALTGKGFDVKTLFLAKETKVPDDASAVIVASPTQALLPQELAALDRYYRDGGKLFVMVDPQTPQGVRTWLASEFQVQAPGGLVLDPASRLVGGDLAVPIAAQYPFNDITQSFTLATAFPVSTPLVPAPKPRGVTLTPVVKASDASYVKVNLDSKDIRFQPGVDQKGPVVLAVEVTPAAGASTPAAPAKAATPTTATPGPPGPKAAASSGAAVATPAPAAPPKGSAVLFGNSGFVRNLYIGLLGNQNLFMSTVAWLTQSGNLVSIAPRASPFDPFIVTDRQARGLFFGGVIGLPVALVIFGASLYFRRRAL